MALTLAFRCRGRIVWDQAGKGLLGYLGRGFAEGGAGFRVKV